MNHLGTSRLLGLNMSSPKGSTFLLLCRASAPCSVTVVTWSLSQLATELVRCKVIFGSILTPFGFQCRAFVVSSWVLCSTGDHPVDHYKTLDRSIVIINYIIH